METFSNRAKRLLGLGRAAGLRTAARQLKDRYRIAMARRRRRGKRAKVTGITCSSAKTTTAELLAHILDAQGSVHKQTKGNTFWPLVRALAGLPRDADYAVMELAAGKSSMASMASLLGPDIAVVTLVADEHRSIFRGAEAVAAEKQWLV